MKPDLCLFSWVIAGDILRVTLQCYIHTYEQVSKYCNFCSKETLILDNNLHAFSCPNLERCRHSSLLQLNYYRSLSGFPAATELNADVFSSSLNHTSMCVAMFDFVVSFFLHKQREWEDTTLSWARLNV